MVFYAKNPSLKSGEYWVTMDRFLMVNGLDYYEKKKRAKENKEARIASKKKAEAKRQWEAEHPDEVLEERKKARRLRMDKANQRSLKRYHATKHLNSEERKKKKMELYYRACKDPIKKQRIKEIAKKAYEKKCGPKREAKRFAREEKLRLIAEKKAVREREIADKKALKEKARLEREANRKPPLTAEQRAESKRNQKRNYKHRRRARLRNCEVRATPKMIQDARASAGDRCYYCNVKADLTLDHFEPLATGGAHCVSNFVFACISCNSSKRDLDPFDFMAKRIATEMPSIGD